jgi:hypothetical protein
MLAGVKFRATGSPAPPIIEYINRNRSYSKIFLFYFFCYIFCFCVFKYVNMSYLVIFCPVLVYGFGVRYIIFCVPYTPLFY